MRERDEAVLRDPDGVRHDKRDADRGGEPQRRRTQQRARVAIDQRRGGDAEHEIDHRVFRQHPEPERHAEQDAPAPVAALPELHIGEQRERPAQQQRHVGRDDAAREREAGGERHQQRGPERGGLVVQRLGDGVGDEAGAEIEHRRRRADAGFGRAADGFRARDHPGEQRRLREVAERELARPRPVLRFVEEQIDLREREPDQPDHGHGNEDDKTHRKAAFGRDARRGVGERGHHATMSHKGAAKRIRPVSAVSAPRPGRLPAAGRPGGAAERNRRTASQAAALAASSSTQTARHNAVRAEVFLRSDMTPPRSRTFTLSAAPHETTIAAGTPALHRD